VGRLVIEPSESIAVKLDQAIALHERGQLGQAEALYREILRAEPGHFDALHLLGIAAGQQGQTQVAIDLFDRALAINPNDAATHYDRGNALLALRRYADALASCERALAIEPGLAEALHNRGIALQALGRPVEALASFERALVVRPDYAEALNNRGNALLDFKRPAEALDSYQRALEIQPDYGDALNGQCAALIALGRPDEALASNDRALAIRPHDAGILNNRGVALQNMGRVEDALEVFRQALAIRPDYAEALNSEASCLVSLNRPDEALASYAHALRIRPHYPLLLGNWLQTKLKLCDWSGLNEAFEHLAAEIAAGELVASPFAIMGAPLSLPLQRKCAEMLVRHYFPTGISPADCQPAQPHERLRLGYFSADFCEHPVAHLAAELFERHDRTRFEVIAYSFGPPVRDPMRLRLEAAFDQFIDVHSKTDQEIAQMAREQGLDIAVDLMGFTRNARTGVFAARAAPVQVSYLGYPGTMGADYIDYLIGDPTIIPAGHGPHYREKIAYLPETFQVNDSQRRIAERTPSRAELGLPAAGFVFCNFNNCYKLSPEDFDIWMRLLQKVQGSVLWLAGTNAIAKHNLRREADARGVAPERLVFKQYTESLADHLAQIRQADLFLDSRYFNAHTTGSDALWAGVPLLTRLGETYASRVGASLLNAAGLPELITETAQDYEALALELATDTARLGDLRLRLAENRLTKPLFDVTLFTRHIEAAYLAMAQRQRAGLAPETIRVAR
jgi:predicted O-linked N-acetylglucosamine transferase (SPINDLY family)